MKILEGKIALVTGGAGGIGLSIAKDFARLGADVTIVDRNRNALKSIGGQLGFECVEADVTEPEECAKKIRKVAERRNGLDILVNNAGLFERKPNNQVTSADWSRILNANLLTPFFASEAAIDFMNGSGSIVCVSSVAAFYARPDQAAYCTSKSALEQLVRVLALDFAKRGIRVNAVRPGIVESDMVQEAVRAKGSGPVNIPLGRFGAPEDVAECVSFLAQARHITGQVITVDGGQTLQFVDPFV